MPRRKQDCPKRMKCEGGEEEGTPDSDKLDGDEQETGEDDGSMSPRSHRSSTPNLNVDNDDAPHYDDDRHSVVIEPSETQEQEVISPHTPPSRESKLVHMISESAALPLPPNSYNEREMSPRSHSRTSTDSPKSQNQQRCPSRDSNYSEQSLKMNSLSSQNLLQSIPLGGLQTLNSSLISGMTIPPTLPPAAAAALMPPNSAAMAAYLGAAAIAAQHSHRLMMTSPLPTSFRPGTLSPLMGSATSPNHQMTSPNSSPVDNDSSALDFSTKRVKNERMDDIVNLSKPTEMTNSPLDLSFTRKRSSDENSPPLAKKSSRTEQKTVVSPWTSPVAPHLPYFAAAVAAASLSPKSTGSLSSTDSAMWNGKKSMTPNDASRALEKMSELSRLGGEDLFRTMGGGGSSANANTNTSTGNRHSAWQSHWLNKGADQAKDVLKCVWCKQSFPSLAAMTTHMKEAKHCGVNVPVPIPTSQSSQNYQQNHMNHPQMNHAVSSASTNTNQSTPSKSQSDLNLLIKETMPLPRKLVRGQDVWLGKGAEQTRQILKCMWCGQSFRSLAEMTSHMQQTQHYTNIISQEQIISWKSSDGEKPSSGSGSSGGAGVNASTNSHVSAVLTCKVCDQAFSSLKELSNHMVKNSHYKEHIMRSITESGGRRRQTREKRKKSLPVRKLLELERAQHEFKNGDTLKATSTRPEMHLAGRITCEKCGDKIETAHFVEHIRQCVGGSVSSRFMKHIPNNILSPESGITGHVIPAPGLDRKSDSERSSPKNFSRPSSGVTDLSTKESEGNTSNSSSSVLNAIEKLIEKSFDSRSRQNASFNAANSSSSNPQTPIGSSILKRLGIDESVDYTKPLVDAQTMNILRNYQGHPHYNRRERSGSESSSVSERTNSRGMDSVTPDRIKIEPTMSPPRSTPDSAKRTNTPLNLSEKDGKKDDVEASIGSIRVKKELFDSDERKINESLGKIKIKKEKCDDDERIDDDHERHSTINSPPSRSPTTHTPVDHSNGTVPNSPSRHSAESPASSDRSQTPRSVTSEKRSTGGSLGALSSMFDSLTGTSTNNNNESGKKGNSHHPLAALQKLCDKTETHHPSNSSRTHQSVTLPSTNPPVSSAASTQSISATTPTGSILAFSWACNDAVMTSDSIMKCAFCDTPFISKGAYRHHLSKMHFVKDGVIPDPIAVKNMGTSRDGKSTPIPITSTVSSSLSSPSTVRSKSPVAPTTSVASGGFDESPHSKFLKYTELAKQLSSKYV